MIRLMGLGSHVGTHETHIASITSGAAVPTGAGVAVIVSRWYVDRWCVYMRQRAHNEPPIFSRSFVTPRRQAERCNVLSH